MNARIRLGLLALCAAAACGDAPTAPLPTAGPARALAYREYSLWGPTRELRALGDTVVFTSRTPSEDGQAVTTSFSRRVPSAEAWREFWRAVDAAGVRRWPGRCNNTDLLDGGGFEFELEWPGGRRAGSYSNAYPTAEGRCTRDGSGTVAADAFRAAVLALAGARTAP